jgi:hypothetical protein
MLDNASLLDTVTDKLDDSASDAELLTMVANVNERLTLIKLEMKSEKATDDEVTDES